MRFLYWPKLRFTLVAAILLLGGGFRATAQSAPGQVSPLQLTFNALIPSQGGGDPSYQFLQIAPTGSDPSFQIQAKTDDGKGWLAVMTPSGSGNASVTVGAFPVEFGLTPGIYHGSLIVTIGSQAPITVAVTLNYTSQVLVINAPASNANPPPQTIAVTTADSMTPWTATASYDNGGTWFTIAPQSGVGPGTITLSANTAGLTQGVYTGFVTINGGTPTGTFIALVLSAPVISGPAQSMIKTDGDFQVGTVGAMLQIPLTVYVSDGPLASGHFALPTQVTFTIASGSARFAGNKTSLTTTTVYGFATANVTFGMTPEIDTITATAAIGEGTVTQTFTVASQAGAIAKLDVASSAPASAITGTALTASVRARDSFGNPVGGFKVAFQATAGTGTLSAMSATTDSNGLASVTWTIGSGANTLTATGAGGFSQTFQTAGIDIALKLVAAPSQLNFSAVEGGPAAASQTVSVMSTPAPGASFMVTTPMTDTWLSVNISSGVAPANVRVSVATGLMAGTYTSAVTVMNSASTVTIPVMVTVAASAPPKLAVAPAQLTFSAVAQSSKPLSQTVRVLNAGGGKLTFTSAIVAPAAISWLSVSPASGSAPADLTVTADPTFQSAGLLSGYITLTGSDASTAIVQVQLNVAAAANSLQIDNQAISFTVAPGATALPSAMIHVLSTTGSPTVTTSLRGPQSQWFTFQSPFSVSASAATTPTTLTVSVTSVPAEPGVYQAALLVNSVEIPLTLIVSSGPPCVSFNGGACTSAGGSVATPMPAPASAAVFQISGAPGLTYTYDATKQMAAVSVDATQAVNGGCLQLGAMQSGDATVYAYQYCAFGTNLLAATTSVVAAVQPQPNFTATAGVPIGVQAVLYDKTGNAIAGGELRVRFSDGTPDIYLKDAGNGTYAAIWTPVNAGMVPSMVALTYTAVSQTDAPSVVISGTVAAAASSETFIPAGSAVNAASFATAPLTPGSLASIFGVNLAATTAQAGVIPLPSTLGGVKLTLNGITAPLVFVSSGQINFQVPFELAGQPSATAELQSGSAIAVLPDIPLSAATPGIFFAAGNQAAITHVDGTLANAAKPASQGETLMLFATGLGAVSPTPATGAAAGVPFSNLIATPSVTVGGKAAVVSYSGLAPGYVGLYQLNVTVPFGLPSGATPVQVQTGQTFSNTATIVLK